MSGRPCGIEDTPRRYRKALSRKVLWQETASGCLRRVSSSQDRRCMNNGRLYVCRTVRRVVQTGAAVAQAASHDCGPAAARRNKLRREGVALYVQLAGRQGFARQAEGVGVSRKVEVGGSANCW